MLHIVLVCIIHGHIVDKCKYAMLKSCVYSEKKPKKQQTRCEPQISSNKIRGTETWGPQVSDES
jgi:hypothetical protein